MKPNLIIGLGLAGAAYWAYKTYGNPLDLLAPDPLGTPALPGTALPAATTPAGVVPVVVQTNTPPASVTPTPAPSPAPTPAPLPLVRPNYLNGPQGYAGPVNTGATPITAGTNTDAMLRSAAGGDRSRAAILNGLGVQLTADVWNDYRRQSGKPQITADLFPDGNRGFVMTASEYLDRVQNAGLGAYPNVPVGNYQVRGSR